MNRPELLAPAGGWEALVAAVQNGADAVYLGGRRFSARAGAENFDDQQISRAVDYCHLRGVRVYVALNTLLADAELDEAARFLTFLYNTGVDAVIVQDLGLIRMAKQILPELELHASTQMTVHNAPAAQFLKDLGLKRIVLARELSLGEIKEIRIGAGVEVEVFIHGALCICYSGQCLMSSLIGGRSGNRGRCAQPCRLPYRLVDRNGKPQSVTAGTGEFLLSPRDINLSRHLPELVGAGIDSFKIEGRMKRPEYVATVVRIYRRLLDQVDRGLDAVVSNREEAELTQIFNRDFSTGYFFGTHGRDLMSYKRPNNRGVHLGRVSRYDRRERRARVLLERSLQVGDGIEIWVTEGGRVGIEVREIRVAGKPVDRAEPGETAELTVEGKIHPGDRVFKTHDAMLVEQARMTFSSSRETRKVPLVFTVRARTGKPLWLKVEDPSGCSGEAVGTVPAETALNRPLTEEFLLQQLDRLGNTPYELERLDFTTTGSIMVPVREINEVRRQALEQLSRCRADRWHRREVPQALVDQRWKTVGHADDLAAWGQNEQSPRLAVSVPDLAGLRAALRGGADIIHLGGDDLRSRPSLTREDLVTAVTLCRDKRIELILATPRIIHTGELDRVDNLVKYAADAGIAGVLTGNLGLLARLLTIGLLPVYGDFGLNVFNRQAVMLLMEAGVSSFTLSPELTMEQIGPVAGLGLPAEAIIHGALPLMVSLYCAPGSLLGGAGSDTSCGNPCGSWQGGLRDRMGVVFPVEVDRHCRMHIFNSRDLCLLDSVGRLLGTGVRVLRVEARKEGPGYVEQAVAAYRRALDSYLAGQSYSRSLDEDRELLAKLSPAGFTRGHYFRGVL